MRIQELRHLIESRNETPEGFVYLKNPLGPELAAFLKAHGEVRGCVYQDNVYCWAANSGTHGQGVYTLAQAGEFPYRPGSHYWYASATSTGSADLVWSRGLKQVGPIWVTLQNYDDPINPTMSTSPVGVDTWSMLIRSLLRMQPGSAQQ